MNSNPSVLLVEDDKAFGRTVKRYLEQAGYFVVHCSDGREAWHLYNSARFDICLIGVVIPGMNGLELAREIRRDNLLTPIFFLSSGKRQEDDCIRSFQAGGDGYLVKPCCLEELQKRIRAILKWTRPHRAELLIGHSLGLYTYHYRKLKVYETATGLLKSKLSPIEARMLRYFLDRPNAIVQKNELLLRVWGKNDRCASRSMDVFTGRIRRLLKPEPLVALETLYNVGLRLHVPDTLMPVRICMPVELLNFELLSRKQKAKSY
jgi:DNA-binding response OmpR family regulator